VGGPLLVGGLPPPKSGPVATPMEPCKTEIIKTDKATEINWTEL